jgi:hypothetical protein
METAMPIWYRQPEDFCRQSFGLRLSKEHRLRVSNGWCDKLVIAYQQGANER